MRALRPCFSSARAHRARKSGTEPNEQAPTPVHASSLYRATRRGWGPSGQPPSWLPPAHSPGHSRPLSRPERHGCHSTSQSPPTTEVTPRVHIARAHLGLWSPRDVSRYLLNACKVAAFGRDVLLSGSASPVLRRGGLGSRLSDQHST